MKDKVQLGLTAGELGEQALVLLHHVLWEAAEIREHLAALGTPDSVVNILQRNAIMDGKRGVQ